jgi:site-specific DNA-methyltransferase (adenine-specific)/modification methylase
MEPTDTIGDDITLYRGDCMAVLPTLADAEIDAVVTDPPYGISAVARGTIGTSKAGKVRDYGKSSWDDVPCSPEQIAEMRRVSRHQIMFGGNFFELPPASCWLVWDKLNSGDFADCELAWTSLKKAIRRIQYRWNGMIRDGDEDRVHPTQKPIAVMRWCIRHLPNDCGVILDPFMGSGTTPDTRSNPISLPNIAMTTSFFPCTSTINGMHQD